MAKPDWGALQDQFLVEHAKTDIFPKDWCEEQGLNYATERRYIKNPSAQNCAKPDATCGIWLLHRLTAILRRKARES